MTVHTNAVTVTIRQASPTDDETRTTRAAARLLAAESNDHAEQEAAARELAFLPGDAAALEKARAMVRQKALGRPDIARILHDGFYVSDHPRVILEALERQLDDMSWLPDQYAIEDLADLKWWIEAREVRRPASGGLLAAPPWIGPTHAKDITDPYWRFRQEYLDRVAASLPRRPDADRLAMAFLVREMSVDSLGAVDEMLKDGFAQLPRWQQATLLRKPEFAENPRVLEPLRAALDAGPPDDDLAEIGVDVLASVDPASAVAPVLRLLASSKPLFISTRTIARLPENSRPTIEAAAARSIRVVAERQKGPELYGLSDRAAIVSQLDTGAALDEVRALLNDFGARFDERTRGLLAAYVERWKRQ